MKTTGVASLKINKLTKTQYEEALAAGNINENEFYIVPGETSQTASNALITIPAGRMRGDIDGDGKITENDSLLLDRHVAGWADYQLTDATQLLCADVDNNGRIDSADTLLIRRVVSGFYKLGICGDVLGNWNKNPNSNTEEAQFYIDISISDITTNHSALVIVKGTYENGFFTKAECIDGAIRIYAKSCPIETLAAVTYWGIGNGTAVITTENINLPEQETEVFIATYDTTTSAEIETAYQANKFIFVKADDILASLTSRSSDTSSIFMTITQDGQIWKISCDNNTWSKTLISKSIPNITTNDSGKYLVVNDSGDWVAEALEDSILIATYGTTTFNELVNAYDSGKVIVAKYNGTIYQLMSADTATSFVFMSITKNSEYVNYIECEFSDDWTTSLGKRFLPDAGTTNSQKILKVNSSGVPEWSDATVDSALSDSSTNPVQNKVINTALNTKVDLSSAQSIAGEKTFSNNLTANANLNVGGDIVATGTITGSKVYNATWNDYAEWFEKNNIEEIFEPGDICVWFNNGVTKSSKACDKAVIGIVSNTYGHILGGKELENMEDNNKEFVPIGLAGRVKCKVIGNVEIGDLIVTSDIPGVGIVNNNACLNQVIGKAIEDSNEDDLKQITLLLN